MKVYELAKELSLSSKEIIERLADEGYDLKSHMSVIPKDAMKFFDIDIEEDVIEEEEEIKIKKKKNRKKSKKEVEKRVSNTPVSVDIEKGEKIIVYKEDMTVGELAVELKVQPAELIKKLMLLGVMANQNQSVDRDTVELLASEYDYEIIDEVVTDLTRFDEIVIEDDESALVKRPPVITIMGHVDHGKTTLLDTIRSANVVSSEAGGITQHIGAYQIKYNDELLTFIDTPGHAAFTEMRSRGAQITDIVVIVVAADDGLMPQTIEAIDHAKAAKVPVIIAVNKMDKVGANPEKVKSQLSEYNLIPEEWGGNTIFCELSALRGDGVDNLLENILLVAEIEELKANPNRLAIGTVIEAKLDKGRGVIASLLIQNGSMKVGDIVVVGNEYGKVRTMHNERNEQLKVALPSTPVEITGLSGVPIAGDPFMVHTDEREAKQISDERSQRAFDKEKGVSKAVSLEDIFTQIKEGNVKSLNVIVKGDVQGSIEALKGSLAKIDVDGVKIDIVRASVGAITETDVTLALASDAVIIGFNVRPSAAVKNYAIEEKVDIRLYNVIYKLIEDLEKAMKGLLDPEYEEKVTGQAEVREVYKVSNVGTIAGCYVTDGQIIRKSGVRVIRNGVVIYEGKLGSLKRFKDDVKEVNQGYECGITVEKFNDIKVEDILETYIMEEVEID